MKSYNVLLTSVPGARSKTVDAESASEAVMVAYGPFKSCEPYLNWWVGTLEDGRRFRCKLQRPADVRRFLNPKEKPIKRGGRMNNF